MNIKKIFSKSEKESEASESSEAMVQMAEKLLQNSDINSLESAQDHCIQRTFTYFEHEGKEDFTVEELYELVVGGMLPMIDILYKEAPPKNALELSHSAVFIAKEIVPIGKVMRSYKNYQRRLKRRKKKENE